MGRREGEDVHVPHGGGGHEVWDRIRLKGKVSGVREGAGGDFDLVPFIEVHQANVVDGGGVRKGHVPGGKVACELKVVFWGGGEVGGLRMSKYFNQHASSKNRLTL